MKILVTSVFVDDQQHALAFYTGVLRFVKRKDIPVGPFRWLTVASPELPDGVELLLEPSENPATQAFKRALREQGIPAAAFFVDDIAGEVARMKQQGVRFTMDPAPMGSTLMAVFDDSCGNLIQLNQIVKAA